MKDKEQYPYIAVFKTLPKPIESKELSSEELEQVIEVWRENIRKGFFSIEDTSKVSDSFYIEQYLTQELYDFINTISIIESTENFGEKVYKINSLQFKIVENDGE